MSGTSAPRVALPGPLVALTPGTIQGGRGFDAARNVLERAVEAAARGGLQSLLLREPFLEDGEILALGTSLARILRSGAGEEPTWFGIHDRVHLAAALDADGAHLGGRSLPPKEARLVLGDAPVALGLSTHEGDDLGALGPVDYLFHAPVFQPRSKKLTPRPDGTGQPFGPEGLGAAAVDSPVPVWGLGGIDADGIQSIASHPGASPPLTETSNCIIRGVAVIGALWGTSATEVTAAGTTDRASGSPASPSPLTDLSGISQRAAELAGAASRVFSRSTLS